MVDFPSAENEQDFVESIRDIFRAYVPESDAWAQPNFFSINSTIIGGLAWSSINEARNGFDTRLNLQTAVGEYLDIIAATPPLNLTRFGATVATGFISVTGWPTGVVPAGFEFQTAAGVKFKADAETTVAAGQGIVAVTSVLTGASNNSLSGQPLTASGNTATAISLGVYGGFDPETDDQFRARIYGERTRYSFFGSPCSYERAILGVRGVTRAWTVVNGGLVSIKFLMEDKYPCGVPLPEDIAEVTEFFNDPCLQSLFFCPIFEPACSVTIELNIDWEEAPDDICAVEAAFEAWLRGNYGLGEGVRACDIDAWLRDTYPENGPSIDCCEDFPPVPCCVYNCAQLTPACDNGTGTLTLNDFFDDKTVFAGQTYSGDLKIVNPQLPPGGVFSLAPGQNLPFGFSIAPNGVFAITNNPPPTGCDGSVTNWSFIFQYAIGDLFGTATAGGFLECDNSTQECVHGWGAAIPAVQNIVGVPGQSFSLTFGPLVGPSPLVIEQIDEFILGQNDLSLPPGVTFTDNGNKTFTLAGIFPPRGGANINQSDDSDWYDFGLRYRANCQIDIGDGVTAQAGGDVKGRIKVGPGCAQLDVFPAGERVVSVGNFSVGEQVGDIWEDVFIDYYDGNNFVPVTPAMIEANGGQVRFEIQSILDTAGQPVNSSLVSINTLGGVYRNVWNSPTAVIFTLRFLVLDCDRYPDTAFKTIKYELNG